MMKQFGRLILAAALSTAPAFADPFTVRSVAVDVTRENSVEAQRIARVEAQTRAANALIGRLTLASDRAAAGGLQIDAATAARLAAGVDVEEEKRGPTTYRGVFSVKFSPQAVRSWLDARDVPFVESQAAKALVAPVAGAGVSVESWGASWSGAQDGDSLAPYVASREFWDRAPPWEALQAEAASAGALRAILAEASIERGQIYVRMTDRRPGEPDVTLAVAGPFPDLAAAKQGAAQELETSWKQASIVRSVGSTAMSLVARFATLDEWVQIRKGLAASRIISGLVVEALSAQGADVSFVFGGRPDQLAADLRARGLSLKASDEGWLLEATATR